MLRTTARDPLDVAVVGAGPAGIGVGAALAELDLDVWLFDREAVGASFRAWPEEMVLTAVYLAGVSLPCLVTAMTVAREVSVRFVAGMLARQSAAACVVAALLAHVGPLFGELLA